MKNIILATIAAMSLSACGDNQNTSVVSHPDSSSNRQEQSEPTEASAPDVTPPQPVHQYVLEDAGEYGYESALSATERQNGEMAGKIIMVRLLPHPDGAYRFYRHENLYESLVTCKEPCEFVKIENSFNGYSNAPEIKRVVTGTLIWAMLQDARAGFLKVYGATPSSHNIVTQVPSTDPQPPEQKPEPNNAVSSSTETGNASGQITLNARQDAWISIVDAHGNKLQSGLLLAGGNKTVSGTPPFQISIGNAEQVQLSFNGSPVDISDKIRGTTAKFELK